MTRPTGYIQDDPRVVAKIPLVLSSELKSKGKSAMVHPVTKAAPSDAEIASAEILGATLIPSSFSLVTPPVQNQMDEGACSAFTVALVRSINWYYKTAANSYSQSVNIFSPEYIYNQAKAGADCYSGSSITGNLNLVYNQGVCRWSVMPQVNQDCSTQPDSTQRTDAADYKIANYSKFISSDIVALKQALLTNRAIALPIAIDNAFLNCTTGFIWGPNTISDGQAPHSVTLIGWDDTKNAFKIQNSFGTGWGDSGFGWIDYELFTGAYTKIGYNCYGNLVEVTLNTAPIADAGFDQSVAGTTATLDGSASRDPDGTIVSYSWAQSSGPNTATIVNSAAPITGLTGLTNGTYVFALTVSDGTTTATDTVTIKVAAAESYTISVTKKTVKGKVIDIIAWNIVLNNVPQSAELQIGATSAAFSTFYNILPYSAAGSYSYASGSKRTRYYRLKVTKFDGTIVYSAPVAIS